MSNVALINKTEIIQRLQNGEYAVDIAKSLNITNSAISHSLANDPEYKAAIEDSLDIRMIKRESEVLSAPDMLNLVRAKELLRHAEFRASVECPKRWGKNADVQVMVAPVFNVVVSDAAPVYTYDQGGVNVQGDGVKG